MFQQREDPCLNEIISERLKKVGPQINNWEVGIHKSYLIRGAGRKKSFDITQSRFLSNPPLPTTPLPPTKHVEDP